jgi:hypothetical protein
MMILRSIENPIPGPWDDSFNIPLSPELVILTGKAISEASQTGGAKNFVRTNVRNVRNQNSWFNLFEKLFYPKAERVGLNLVEKCVKLK